MLTGNLSTQETAALRAYVQALHQRFGSQLVDILLFGSKARGEAHPNSDIDVIVILEHSTAKDLSNARGLGFDIWLAYDVWLSVRVMTSEDWQGLADMQSLLYRNVLREGISLLAMPA
ncbi:MAG: nucleotidyltransferase domain-containing protein [Chloroflexi bacterium]|nr:nucleotidyltransferase domain-containing protein [Chloroflexota bacterium]